MNAGPKHLLGHPDRGYLRAARGSSPLQVGTHHLCRARRGRHRVPAVLEELDHLPAHLQLRQVAVQVEPVQALQVKRNMAVQRM
jgi:hypothetical protein